MYYNVYLAEYLDIPLNHHVIFVETMTGGAGNFFHVASAGEKATQKDGQAPEQASGFIRKKLVGTVAHTDFDKIQPIVEATQAPSQLFDGSRANDIVKSAR